MSESEEGKLFDKFYSIAQMEAKSIRREFGEYLQLYEEDDLINWAYVSGFWKKYSDSDGAMRQVIRFAMLRGLAKAQDYDRGGTKLSLEKGIPLDEARAAGLVDKNQPNKKWDRRAATNELINKQADDPLMQAILGEIRTIIEDSGLFSEKDQQILTGRLYDEETFSSISHSVCLTRQGVRKRYDRSINELRRALS
jgi:hypothetical protein